MGKIITLCGSTKFRKDFELVSKELTLKGNIVISVGLFGHESGLNMNSDTKRMLDKLHFKKIDISDAIFVINPNRYIGLSTCDEIYYAMANKKKVYYLVDPNCEYILQPSYACGCSCDPQYGHRPSCMFDNWSSETEETWKKIK